VLSKIFDKASRMQLRPWIAFAAFLVFAAVAKSDTLPVTFSGGNPGDGGTITTDGCTICSEADITGFDFTLQGFEFSSPTSPISFSLGAGNLLGHDSLEFRQTAAQFPLLELFDDGSWTLIASEQYVEAPDPGQFTLGSPQGAVPEPSSLLLSFTVLLTLGLAARRRLSNVKAEARHHVAPAQTGNA
jgi:hypothetical protein